MKELQPKDQQALTALLTELDKHTNSIKANTFNPREHEPLLEKPAVALHLITLLLASSDVLDGQQQENRGVLLQYSLKMCLTDDECSAAAIAELQQTIEQMLSQYLATRQTPDFPVLRALINILFRLDILVSDELLARINQAEYPQVLDSVEFSEEVLHTILAEIAAESSDASLYELAAFLFEQFSQLPPAVAPMIATMLLQANDIKLQHSATLFLLHPHPLFRKAMLEALPSLAQQKLLRAVDLQRLVWLRNWLQKDAHPTLDRCIKLLQRQQLPVMVKNETVTISAASATPIDSSGAMMLIVELQQDDHFLLFTFMLKQGDGIKEAFITPPLPGKSLNEMKSHILGHMPVTAIDNSVLAAVLEHFLLKSREHQRLPLALLLFRELTAGIWGIPQAIDEAQIRHALHGQSNHPNNLELSEFLAGWAKRSNRPKQDLVEYINTQMEPVRERWRERFLLTALVFAKTANDMPQLFQAALEIAAGSPLHEIDEIRVIAMYSLHGLGVKSA